MTKTNTCNNCKWFEFEPNCGDHECMINPPVLVIRDSTDSWIRPRIDGLDYCAQFSRNWKLFFTNIKNIIKTRYELWRMN